MEVSAPVEGPAYSFRYMGRRSFDLEPRRAVDVHLTVSSRTAYDVMHIVKRLGLGVKYVHDGGPWYKAFDWMNVSHRREKLKRS